MAFEWTREEDGALFRLDDNGVLRFQLIPGGSWYQGNHYVALQGFRRAVEQLEVYRKAAEPFARAFLEESGEVDCGLLWVEASLDKEEREVMAQACRLMGLLPAAEDVLPEATASAEEAFEGKSDQDTINLMQALKDALRARGKGAKE